MNSSAELRRPMLGTQSVGSLGSQKTAGYPVSAYVKDGDYILLSYSEEKRWLIKVAATRDFHTHKGIIRLADILNKPYGSKISSSLGADFWVLKPSIYDFLFRLSRLTQIMYPKDIGLIILRLGLSPGKIALEVGTGSGVMAAAAASILKPTGHLYTYEARPEFAELARRNLVKLGLERYVTIRQLDAKLGLKERNVQAVIIDVGDPWEIIPHAYKAILGGAPLVSFSPTINQVEKTVTELKRTGFTNIETVELFMRNIRVQEGKTRPFSRMIGHTGYLTFANKILRE